MRFRRNRPTLAGRYTTLERPMAPKYHTLAERCTTLKGPMAPKYHTLAERYTTLRELA